MKNTENDEYLQKILNMNYRVLTLLGMMTALLVEWKNRMPRSEYYKFDWFMQALNDVVYNNKPIPPIPESELL